MAAVSVGVILRRAPRVPGVTGPAIIAVSGSAVLSIIVIFGFDVLELEPVRLVGSDACPWVERLRAGCPRVLRRRPK